MCVMDPNTLVQSQLTVWTNTTTGRTYIALPAAGGYMPQNIEDMTAQLYSAAGNSSLGSNWATIVDTIGFTFTRWAAIEVFVGGNTKGYNISLVGASILSATSLFINSLDNTYADTVTVGYNGVSPYSSFARLNTRCVVNIGRMFPCRMVGKEVGVNELLPPLSLPPPSLLSSAPRCGAWRTPARPTRRRLATWPPTVDG